MNKTYLPTLFQHLTLLVVVLSFAACATISSFDQYAYAQTTSLKVDAINTMSMATGNYSTNEKTVQELQTKLQKAYEYEKHRSNNGITVKMWELLKNPNRNLFGGFLKRWQEKKTLSATFITEAKTQVSEAFDMIVELESQKIKPDDKKVSTFISTNQ